MSIGIAVICDDCGDVGPTASRKKEARESARREGWQFLPATGWSGRGSAATEPSMDLCSVCCQKHHYKRRLDLVRRGGEGDTRPRAVMLQYQG